MCNSNSCNIQAQSPSMDETRTATVVACCNETSPQQPSEQQNDTLATNTLQSSESISMMMTTTTDLTIPENNNKSTAKRTRKTIAAGIVGGAAGLLVLGPFGAVAGGVGTAMITKRVRKAKEKQRYREEIAATGSDFREASTRAYAHFACGGYTSD